MELVAHHPAVQLASVLGEVVWVLGHVVASHGAIPYLDQLKLQATGAQFRQLTALSVPVPQGISHLGKLERQAPGDGQATRGVECPDHTCAQWLQLQAPRASENRDDVRERPQGCCIAAAS